VTRKAEIMELLYRIRYAWHMRKQTRCSWSFAWDSAKAFDMEDVDDMSPYDAVCEELSCWDA